MSPSVGTPRALILAGGRGLRLKPFTFAIPKPLIPLGERAMIEVIVRQLRAAAVGPIYVALNYLAHLIRIYLRDLDERQGIHCECLQEDEPLGTAGAISLLPAARATTVVSNADVLTDLDWAGLLAAHARGGADMTIVGVRHVLDLPYGNLETDGGEGFRGWSEKQAVCRLVSGGIYVLEPALLDLVRPGERLDMPDLARRAQGRGARIAIHEHDGTWFDVGDWTQYERAVECFGRRAAAFAPALAPGLGAPGARAGAATAGASFAAPAGAAREVAP
jgi:NDP-sugar pyrophosphorylase family protein